MAKLPEWSGLKWGKFLFYTMHWADIMSNDACNYSTSLKNSLLIALIKRESTEDKREFKIIISMHMSIGEHAMQGELDF